MSVLLSIAGSDSGAGAGIQADLKTAAAFGVYAITALTAITAQNTLGVQQVELLSIDIIEQQLISLASDFRPQAIKIGMLGNDAIIEVVCRTLECYYADIPVVLDPVMIAKSGDALLDQSAIQTLRQLMIPMATIITPNLPEASALLDWPTISQNNMQQAAFALQALGAKQVLLKGGHLAGDDAVDLLVDQQRQCHWFHGDRIQTRYHHGTGCTLSAAVASGLALGWDMPTACQKAKQYVSQALVAGMRQAIGHGCGPLDHFPHRGHWATEN